MHFQKGNGQHLPQFARKKGTALEAIPKRNLQIFLKVIAVLFHFHLQISRSFGWLGRTEGIYYFGFCSILKISVLFKPVS